MNRIKQLRKAQHINQETLSALLGVKQQTLSKYETGKLSPDYKSLAILADYFHTTVDYLIGRVDDDRDFSALNAQTERETALLEQFRCMPPAEQDALMIIIDRKGSSN